MKKMVGPSFSFWCHLGRTWEKIYVRHSSRTVDGVVFKCYFLFFSCLEQCYLLFLISKLFLSWLNCAVNLSKIRIFNIVKQKSFIWIIKGSIKVIMSLVFARQEFTSSWKDWLTLTNWNGQKGGDFLMSRVRWMGN